MKWDDPQRFEYGSLETAATDVQQFGEWQAMDADSFFRFEYTHHDDYDDGMGEAPAILQLLVSEDEGDTYTIIASQQVVVPNVESGNIYMIFVEGLIRKGLSYKVVISPSLLTYDGSGQLPGGLSIYHYSFATLIPTENQP